MDNHQNPVVVALCHLATLVRGQAPGNHLFRLLLVWFELSGVAGGSPEAEQEWWVEWSLEAFALVGHMCGQLMFRFMLKMKDMPFAAWRPLAVKSFEGHRSEGHLR